MDGRELLWSDAAEKLEIHLSRALSPEVLGLLERTVWGNRDLRYRIRGLKGKLGRMTGPHFLTLERGGGLLAVCVLNRRESRLLGAPIDTFHFAMIATDPAEAGQGHARLLAEQAAELCRQRLDARGAAFAYIESTTEFSIRISNHLGPSFEARLPLTLFSRLWPRNDPRAEPLDEAEAAEVLGRLQALYTDHLFADFELSLNPAEYHVLREDGRIVAGAQVEMLNWSVESLPGAVGGLIVCLLPHLPLVRQILNPRDVRVLRFANLLVEQGCEAHLLRLMEAMLARNGVRLGLIMLDERSPPCQRIRAHGRLGLLGKAVDGAAAVVADFKGFSEEELARIRAQPMLMSPLDVF
jgi:GNAT superfamily N-acetyltransferase